jgi:hypothetical protein
MNKIINICFLLLVFISCRHKTISEFALLSERKRFIAEKQHFVDSVFTLKPDTSNEQVFEGAFWASELMQYKPHSADTFLSYALQHYHIYSEHFKRSLLQHIYTLYPGKYMLQTGTLLKTEINKKLFAMLAEYLLQSDSLLKDSVFSMIHNRFKSPELHPVFSGLILFHSGYQMAGINDLMNLIEFRKNSDKATIYIITPKIRNLPGYALIQKPGEELLEKGGDTLKIRLLARSITNLPGYLTNGNTPTGVFSFREFSKSDNVFIGPTETIVTELPFEAGYNEFTFDKNVGNEWNQELYEKLFPESWSNLTQKNLAYFAGKAGRSEITIHGTTINPEFYAGEKYYPFTPSLGCVSTLELWNIKSGQLMESEQQKLVRTLKKNNITEALVYVIEMSIL